MLSYGLFRSAFAFCCRFSFAFCFRCAFAFCCAFISRDVTENGLKIHQDLSDLCTGGGAQRIEVIAASLEYTGACCPGHGIGCPERNGTDIGKGGGVSAHGGVVTSVGGIVIQNYSHLFAGEISAGVKSAGTVAGNDICISCPLHRCGVPLTVGYIVRRRRRSWRSSEAFSRIPMKPF